MTLVLFVLRSIKMILMYLPFWEGSTRHTWASEGERGEEPPPEIAELIGRNLDEVFWGPVHRRSMLGSVITG